MRTRKPSGRKVSSIKDYEEKIIRRALQSKLKNYCANISTGDHEIWTIKLEGKLVGKITIPNDHKRVMKQSKSKFIARDLKLTDNYHAFNELIDCPLSGPNYMNLVKDQL